MWSESVRLPIDSGSGPESAVDSATRNSNSKSNSLGLPSQPGGVSAGVVRLSSHLPHPPAGRVSLAATHTVTLGKAGRRASGGQVTVATLQRPSRAAASVLSESAVRRSTGTGRSRRQWGFKGGAIEPGDRSLAGGSATPSLSAWRPPTGGEDSEPGPGRGPQPQRGADAPCRASSFGSTRYCSGSMAAAAAAQQPAAHVAALPRCLPVTRTRVRHGGFQPCAHRPDGRAPAPDGLLARPARAASPPL